MKHSARTYAIEHYISRNDISNYAVYSIASNPSKSSSEIYPIQPF